MNDEKRALITGVTGFTGSHLTEYPLEEGKGRLRFSLGFPILHADELVETGGQDGDQCNRNNTPLGGDQEIGDRPQNSGCRYFIAIREVYPNELLIKETNPLRPLSSHGVSKAAQDKLSYQYHKSYGLEIVVTRAFNHTGPRRGEVFVTSNFAKQIAEMEKGKEPAMCVGNLDARRDFSDVRDAVRA